MSSLNYIVKGFLAGQLCGNGREPLRKVTVKLYATENGPTSSDERYSFVVLSDQIVEDKEPHLIGEGTTDAQGNYEINLLGPYNDGPIALDLFISKIPNHDTPLDKGVQLSVTVLHPVWRDEAEGNVYSWNYCFSYSVWSGIRTMFDAWVLCGHLKLAQGSEKNIAGLTVYGYDADWLKDDYLGKAVTNEKGYFQIDYRGKDFKRTFLSPMVNIETPISLTQGPDVYFKVTDAEGTVWYAEERSNGFETERRSVPKCFYIDLYI